MLSSSARLLSDLDVEVQPDAPIGSMTWYGIGGRADLLVRPASIDALATLVKRCRKSRTPLRVLGRGANLLVADEGVDGIVVRLDHPELARFDYNPDGPVERIRAMAGADLAKTIMDTARRGLRGLHHLAGIPASIGGAIRMNAGGKFGDVSDHVRSVTCIDPMGRIVVHDRASIDFAYRTSSLTEPVIVAAEFDLEPDDPIRVRDEIKEIFAFKSSTQPLADHSAGCTFRNPVDPSTEQRVSAGKLIDAAGGKGLSEGEAEVSGRHANFIVTRGGATATDVLHLMERVQDRVFRHAGLRLEPELVVWRRGDPAGTLGATADTRAETDSATERRHVLDLDD
ncbi:MAG: UDP-N-acetylmuramate dehydrogenase [Phycisphaerales bacterium]